MPLPEYNPLAPTIDPQFPTELPQGRYDIAVFVNRFPSMTVAAQDAPTSIVETLPANGACEVGVFTQDPQASLGQPHPESHLHAEFYPLYRTKDRLKYLAGTKMAAGMFANDALPEQKVKELQAVSIILKEGAQV
jgi:hypothetical protein